MSCAFGNDGKCVSCLKSDGEGECMGDDGLTDAERSAAAKSRMYILVRNSVPPGLAIVAAAHASLGGYLHFVEQESRARPFNHSSTDVCPDCGQLNPGYPTDTQKWACHSFRKVVCSVSDAQFEEAKSYGVAGVDYRVMTESSLDKAEVSIVFKPRADWEQFFRSLPLWGKHLEQAGCEASMEPISLMG